MKCPYCAKEMEAGSIQNGRRISWYNTTKKHYFVNIPGVNDIILSDLGLFGSGVIAHLCRDCEKIVIDYGDMYSDMNVQRKG